MRSPLDLLGTWRLERAVDDRLTGEQRTVVGTATLRADGPDLVVWTEAGTMTWPGHSVPVERMLHVTRDAASAGWVVRFADGRVFHPWSVGHAVDHPCAPDHYRGLIEVDGDPVRRWTVEWEARGPHKDYLMRTTHSGRRTAGG